MHVLTLVVSFTYRIPRLHWPFVMSQLLENAVHRRICQATVLFRDALYDDDLLTAFGEHASRWRHVMSDICFYYGGGYRTPSAVPESWSDDDDDDADADDLAADYDTNEDSDAFRLSFRAHMLQWECVMHQLLILHAPSLLPILRRLHRGPIHHPSLFRRRRSVSLRIALARRLTARSVRRSLLPAFNTICHPE